VLQHVFYFYVSKSHTTAYSPYVYYCIRVGRRSYIHKLYDLDAIKYDCIYIYIFRRGKPKYTHKTLYRNRVRTRMMLSTRIILYILTHTHTHTPEYLCNTYICSSRVRDLTMPSINATTFHPWSYGFMSAFLFVTLYMYINIKSVCSTNIIIFLNIRVYGKRLG